MVATSYSILGAALVSQAAAHGLLRTFTLDGVDYDGYSFQDGTPSPDQIGWSFSTNNEGPELDLSSPDFICRQDAEPAQSSGTIAAGGQMGFFWTSDDKQINPNGWAESHKGPILTYIAPCNGDCSSVDKTSLRWTKIDEQGVSGSGGEDGTWATDNMIANGGVATATLPSSIAPGNYVIRHELIALHQAHLGIPEFYPQCGNIEVTGDGTDDLSGSGVAASQLYSTSDEGLYGFNLYGASSDYPIPGPPLYSGAGSSTPGNGTSTTTPPPTPADESTLPTSTDLDSTSQPAIDGSVQAPPPTEGDVPIDETGDRVPDGTPPPTNLETPAYVPDDNGDEPRGGRGGRNWRVGPPAGPWRPRGRARPRLA